MDHIISIEEDSGGVFRFNVIVPGKTVELKTESGKDRNRWIKFFLDYVNAALAEPADDILGKTGKSRFKTVKVNIEERERKKLVQREEQEKQKSSTEEEKKGKRDFAIGALDLKSTGWMVIQSQSSSASVQSPITTRKGPPKMLLGTRTLRPTTRDMNQVIEEKTRERERSIEALLSPRSGPRMSGSIAMLTADISSKRQSKRVPVTDDNVVVGAKVENSEKSS